ncbi:TetR/AcrR family transcriptional regulator [Nocardia sp. CNY236]|uniref:TetR/AcrR family transcriptional regulator n=1 Tax=Nocardia sp. CNY236 TaxID=1169152 RepID=UPI000427D17E|nr:TetR family transcriptional regulator [Nocardia sp. CNY236]
MTEPDTQAAVRGATAKGARRRAALLDVAEDILFESGHEALTLRAVAARAGIRLGHVQYYFATRADIVGAVLDRTLSRSLDRLAPLLEDVTGPAANVIRRLLAEQDDPHVVRIYAELWALAGRDDQVTTAVRRFYDSYQQQVTTVITERNPVAPRDLCRRRAQVLTILLEGASLFRSGIADRIDARTEDLLIATAAALLDEGPNEWAPTAG